MTDGLSAQLSLPSGCRIEQMTRADADVLAEWAAQEGWNPGLADIDVAWAYDPAAFIALWRDDELAGGGAIIAYERAAGFMGLFIMRADLRRHGLGRVLWHERLRRLRARLDPDAPIGMDGVFEMVPFYEAGGFKLLYRDLRFEGQAWGTLDPDVAAIDQIPWPELAAYDAATSGIRRSEFMRGWLTQSGGVGFGLRRNGSIVGYGFARPCRRGFKIGPLYAEDGDTAERLLTSLLSVIRGEIAVLDIPEPNLAALDLMRRLGWTQSFGCARMVYGTPSEISVSRIFGVTSFEFG